MLKVNNKVTRRTSIDFALLSLLLAQWNTFIWKSVSHFVLVFLLLTVKLLDKNRLYYLEFKINFRIKITIIKNNPTGKNYGRHILMNVLIFKLVHVPVSLKIFDTPCKTASKEKQTQKKRNISKNRQKSHSYFLSIAKRGKLLYLFCRHRNACESYTFKKVVKAWYEKKNEK